MSQATKEELVIAGLPLNVYKSSRSSNGSKPLVVFFLLHGRYGSAESIEAIANSMIEQAQDGSEDRELLVITFVRTLIRVYCEFEMRCYGRTTETMEAG